MISGFHTNFQQYSDHFHLGLLHEPAMRYLRWFHNQTLSTLVASSTQQRELSRLGVNNLSLLGRGVDCSRFHPAHRSNDLRSTWGAADNDLVMLHVGRLSPEKNLTLLAEAWEQVSAQNTSGRKLHLVIVGDGPSRAELQRRLPHAVFTGALTGEPLAAAYASGDVFVFPSLTETFGNVVTEAMASGLAVCAFDTAAAHQPSGQVQRQPRTRGARAGIYRESAMADGRSGGAAQYPPACAPPGLPRWTGAVSCSALNVTCYRPPGGSLRWHRQCRASSPDCLMRRLRPAS
ncbi:glycosyltransferase [Halopseudomonas pachastrellae]|nr:glycosyltransferase [Halopseudomonas pachastrellae]